MLEGKPEFSGVLRDGETLRLRKVGAMITSLRNDGHLSFQWQRCNPAGLGCTDIEGVTTDAHRLGAEDVGSTLRVVVTLDSGESAVSAAPRSVADPVVFFSSSNGHAAAFPGSWAGTPPFKYTYTWSLCAADGSQCRTVHSSASGTFVAPRDAAGSLVVEVEAANDVGASSARSSTVAVEPAIVPATTPRAGGTPRRTPAQTRRILVCDGPNNVVPPVVSFSGSYAGNGTVNSTAGNWANQNCGPIEPVSLQILYGGSWIANGSSYGTGPSGNYTSQGQACDVDGCSGWVSSSNSVFVSPPPNQAPGIYDFGPDGGTTPTGGPVWVHVLDDENDQITVRQRNFATNAVEQTIVRTGAAPHTVQYFYLDNIDGHKNIEIEVKDPSHPAVSVTFDMWGTHLPTQATPVSPQPAALVTSPTPVLTATSSDPDPNEGSFFEFRVSASSACAPNAGGTLVSASPPLGSAWTASGQRSMWAPPSGLLKDGVTYWWCVRSGDPQITSGEDGNARWSAPQSFTVKVPGLGVQSQWPMLQRGPLAVNEATGNLVVALPAPSYPTGIGDLSMSVTYNTLDARSDLFGLGARWILGTLGGVPARLFDHNLYPGPNEVYDGIERVNADGSSSYYTHVGTAASGYYLSDAGDRSQLFRNPNGSWTLSDPDGSIYTFLARQGTDTFYRLNSAEVAVGKAADTKFSVQTDGSGRVDWIKAMVGTAVLSTLDFNWACSGALLCVLGPDGRTWQYLGETGATGRLQTVRLSWSGGTRDLARVTYDGSGRIVNYETANDIADTVPGWQGTHKLSVDFDASGRVSKLTDGPIRSASGGATLSPAWTFVYSPATPTVLTSAAPHPKLGSAVSRTAVGFTTVCPPRQQPVSPPGCLVTPAKVYYDGLWQTMQMTDIAGNTSKVAYDGSGRVQWSEDPAGNPTDVTFDSLTSLVTKTEAPDPDGNATTFISPTTSYRYDEKAVGTVSTSGTLLTGLQGAYFTTTTAPAVNGQDLSGRPLVLQNDSPGSGTFAFSWAGSPASNGSSSVTADSFGVRWRGLINVPSTGEYRFATNAVGGTRLFIDGMFLLDSWTSQSGYACGVEASLTSGWHQITLEYRDSGTGTASVQLRRTAAGGSCPTGTAPGEVVVPVGELRPNWGNQTSTITPKNTDPGPDLLSFSHFAEPWLGVPDYTLAQNGSEKLVTTFTYDAQGRVLTKVMPKGNTGRTIDAATGDLGAPSDATLPPKYQTTWAYYLPTDSAAWDTGCGTGPAATTQFGLPKSITTAGLATETTVYDSGGRVLSAKTGQTLSCNTFNADGRLASSKARKGTAAFTTTTYQYDPDGRALVVSDPSGTLTSEFNEAGALIQGTDSSGGATPANGAKVKPTYDLEGNAVTRLLQMPNAGSSYTTTYTYTNLNQLSTLIDPAGREYRFLYDSRGNLQVTNYNTNQGYPTTRWQATNPTGWVTAVRFRHGTSTLAAEVTDASPIAEYAYTYFQNGTRKSQTRTGVVGTEATGYVYDPVGRLEQVTFPGGTSRKYCFDPDSNRTSYYASSTAVCGAAGPAASYLYNNAVTPGVDQLTSVTQGAVTNYTYDNDGNVTQRGSDTLTWDAYGRLAGGTFNGSAVTYTFDPAGFRKQRTAGAGTPVYASTVLSDSPSAYWRLGETSGTSAANQVAGAPAGAYTTTAGGSGGYTLGVVGALAGDPDRAVTLNGTSGYVSIPSNAALDLTDGPFSIEFWVKRSATGRTDEVIDKGVSGSAYRVRIGSGNQIIFSKGSTEVARTATATVDTGWHHVAVTKTLSGAGQVVHIYLDGVDAALTLGSTTAFSNNASTLQIGFDNAGSPSYLQGTIDEVALYKSVLTQARVQAHYQAGVTPPGGSTTTNYLLGGLIETNAAGTVTSYDVDGPAGDLAHYAGPPTVGTAVSFAFYDAHGDLVAETTTNATGKTNYTTDPFGAPLQTTPSNTTTERFTAQWDKKLDTTSNLVEMGARPYDPAIGRFLTTDPIEGGSWNQYDYAWQDPINSYDLDGAAPGDRTGPGRVPSVVARAALQSMQTTLARMIGTARGIRPGMNVGRPIGSFAKDIQELTKYVDVKTIRPQMNRSGKVVGQRMTTFDGTRIVVRPNSKSTGPAIDVTVPGARGTFTFHYNQP